MSERCDLFDLEGQTAVVTGGSRGLGLQMAEALAAFGARVLLSGSNTGALEQACDRLAAVGPHRAEFFAADLTRPPEILALVDRALARLGHVDILINNAGTTWGAPAEDHPLAAWDRVFALNVRAVFLLTQAVGKRSMIPRTQGRIINVSSVAGLRGNAPGTIQTLAYSSSKGALLSFTRSLAAEWGRFGITVNALAPGFFPSEMTRVVIERCGEEKLMGNAPLRRLGGADDLKGATLLLASAAGKHITGQVLAVDGGYTAV